MIRNRWLLGMGALACAMVLASACNKKGTTKPGLTGGSSGSGVTAVGDSGTTGGSGTGTVGGTGGTKSSAGTSGGTGGTTMATGGTSAGGAGGTNSGTGGTGGTGGSAATGTCPGAPGCPMCKGSGTALTGTCESQANGVYAMQVSVDAWWDAKSDPTFGPLVSAGRGKVVIYLKGEISSVCEDGSSGIGTMHACGAVLPPFVNDTLCEAYQLNFPDALWDSPKMPTFMTTGTTDGFNPGNTLSIAEAIGLVGIDIGADSKATWPSSAMGVTCMAGTADKCFPDHDNDMNPGITVTINTSGTLSDPAFKCSSGSQPTYAGAPIDAIGAALGGPRGSKLYMGIRNGLGGGGKIDDGCATGSGASTASTIDSHIIGCFRDDNMVCTTAEWQFVDMNSPVYKILKSGDKPGVSAVSDQSASMGPLSKVKRLADPGAAVTCAMVRDAFK